MEWEFILVKVKKDRIFYFLDYKTVVYIILWRDIFGAPPPDSLGIKQFLFAMNCVVGVNV